MYKCVIGCMQKVNVQFLAFGVLFVLLFMYRLHMLFT